MNISIIGAGAMGGSMARGFLKTDVFKPEQITMADASQAILDGFAATGVNTTRDNKAAVKGADIVCIVVKPWIVESVLDEIRDSLDYANQRLVVVAAGTKLQWLSEKLPPIPTFLVIPNTAIAEKCSMTFIVPSKDASPEDTATIKQIFDAVGMSMIVEEKLLPAGTTLASCGIAYAMRYVRAASEGGVEIGFKADMAKEIVLQTMKGAVQLLQANGNHPEAEIDKVTTPGGITIKGLNEMEHAGFTSAVIRGLKAAL